MLIRIPDLQRDRSLKQREAESILDKAGDENRTSLTKAENERLDDLWAGIRTLDIQIKNAERHNRMEMGAGHTGDPGGSIGQAFTDSDEYREMIKKGTWNSDPVQYRDIISSKLADGSYGVGVMPEFVPQIVGAPQQPLRVRDLLNRGTTTQNSVAFVRETLFDNKAAAVKESIEGSEQTKPESVKQFENVVVNIETIAHWIPATRQIVADAPALTSLLNSQLIYGLKVAEEWELLHGEGGSPHLTGICPLATVYDSTLPTQLGVTDAQRIDDIRAAIYQVGEAYYDADAVVLNPFDWAAMELTKEETTGKYLWVSVTDGGVPRMWRLPVVVSHQMVKGDFLVGAFKMGAQLWDREEANIRIAEQHEEFFVKNLVAILAEERLALAVYCPQSFVSGTFEEYGS
jgi:HK97 family phage major capsid protein